MTGIPTPTVSPSAGPVAANFSVLSAAGAKVVNDDCRDTSVPSAATPVAVRV